MNRLTKSDLKIKTQLMNWDIIQIQVLDIRNEAL